MTVRFDDYRELPFGWYPYEITYSLDQRILERYLVVDLQVNRPIEPSFFTRPLERPEKAAEPEDTRAVSEEDRLEEVIRLLEEKYR